MLAAIINKYSSVLCLFSGYVFVFVDHVNVNTVCRKDPAEILCHRQVYQRDHITIELGIIFETNMRRFS
jgi:hypothetical protein